jgi:hypothetical protein
MARSAPIERLDPGLINFRFDLFAANLRPKFDIMPA